MEVPIVPFHDVHLETLVARGHSSSLFRAVVGGTVMAAKVMPYNNQQSGHGSEHSSLLLRDFYREISIVRQFNHPNLCHFYGASMGPTLCCLLYEFLGGGSLSDLIHDRNRSYDVIFIAKEIAKGMYYMHQQNIIHRDLKPSNVLLGVDGQVKVVDFGLSCHAITAGEHTG